MRSKTMLNNIGLCKLQRPIRTNCSKLDRSPPALCYSWIELILKNRLARGECSGTYKHMIKFTLNPCKTLKS